MKKKRKKRATAKAMPPTVQVVTMSAKGKGAWTYRVNQIPTYPPVPHPWNNKSHVPARQKYNEVF